MNPLTELRAKLIEVLGHIQQSNGFYSNAGLSVRTGWFEDVIQSASETGPLIVVQPGSDGQPFMEAGQLVLNPGYMIVAATDGGFADYQSALDDIEHDIYSALAKRGTRGVPWAAMRTYKIEFGEPIKAPPGGGSRMASIAIPVNFRIIINRFEP